MLEFTIKGVTGGIAGFFAWLFGSWDILLQFLLLAMMLDFLTGIMAGAIEQNLSSKIGRKGIARKLNILVIVIIGHFTDLLLEDQSMNIFEIEINFPIRTLVILFYLGNEILSITENSSRIGLPVPNVIKNLFKQIREKGNSGNPQDPTNKNQ